MTFEDFMRRAKASLLGSHALQEMIARDFARLAGVVNKKGDMEAKAIAAATPDNYSEFEAPLADVQLEFFKLFAGVTMDYTHIVKQLVSRAQQAHAAGEAKEARAVQAKEAAAIRDATLEALVAKRRN